ncbi:hypothetical protein [Paracoccus ravus]|uniref:hypothetical protein n=1 Tax=Paracoccus ravus TaxID=2447760 RepID=UPI00106F0207|nr:hypothetical protein [Paracoccus ravus]
MSPEAALWSSVVVVAIRDARRGDARARAWLARRSPDLALVCALAGLDPEWLLRIAPRLIGKALGEPATRLEGAGMTEPSVAELLTRLAALRRLAA